MDTTDPKHSEALARVVDLPRAGTPDAGVTFRAIVGGQTEMQRKQEHLNTLIVKLMQSLGARPPLLKVQPRPQPSASAPVFTQLAHQLLLQNQTIDASTASIEACLEHLR